MCRKEKFAKFDKHVGGKNVDGNLFKKFNENVGRDYYIHFYSNYGINAIYIPYYQLPTPLLRLIVIFN